MSDLRRKNRIVALCVCGAVLFMAGLAFASVPLYNLFCRVTGYGGTVQTAQILPETVSERKITIKFNAGIDSALPWRFAPEQHEIVTQPGLKTVTAYRAENLSRLPAAGASIYNVSPPKAGKYFHKIECFCFSEQILEPLQQVSMPVLFFIDPAIDEDPAMKDVTTITLSYTFYKADSEALDKALEAFYSKRTPAGGEAS